MSPKWLSYPKSNMSYNGDRIGVPQYHNGDLPIMMKKDQM